MTTLSNLYVEKVNSEHPIAVWMLNEDVDYLSLITETERQVYNSSQWTVIFGTASQETPVPDGTPFPDSALSRIAGSAPATPTATVSLTSDYLVPVSNLNSDLANFALSFHLYIDNPYTNSVSFGYIYTDPLTLQPVKVLETKSVSSLDSGSWLFFANTFENLDSSWIDPKFLIEIEVESGGGTGDYDFLINGLTVGQWSEEFNKNSLGVNPIPLPSNIALPIDQAAGAPECVEAIPYGSSSLKGYYLSHDYRLYAQNFGVPLVFGSSNISRLYSHSHTTFGVTTYYPSLILPGYGFLNERGRYNDYTAEMWLRINTDAELPRKIFGTITGNDGLYVEGGFLTLVIGDTFGSFYVGEWYRPMLIHIRYIRNNISVLLNGEEIISLTIDQNTLDLPEEFDNNGDSQDWLGFYAYDDVRPLEIDSFAIYSYPVPVEVAKRRWVWGQGVVPPETTNSALNATTAFNDYSFANYAVNYNYPDFASWRQSFFSNVETSSNFLELPEYSLPFIELGGYSNSEWFSDLKESESATAAKYMTFRPSAVAPGSGRSWSGKLCYMYFSNLSILNDPIESFYGLFESDGSASNQVLFKLINTITGDIFQITLNSTTITYSATIGSTTSTIATKTITANQKFVAGVNIPALSLFPITGINKFFVDQSSIRVYIAGEDSASETFSGKIYAIGFDAAYNSRKTNTLFDSNGIYNSNSVTANAFNDHVANYTLKAYEKYNLFFIDIAVAGYWSDYMPLSYFGKYVTNYDGEQFYDLDSIQINLDYPEPLEVSSLESVSSWTYADLKSRYEDPTQLDYSILDNNFYSGWDDYEDMSQDSEKYYYYATEKNSLKSYISFQRISDGANNQLVDFEYNAVARTEGVVDPDVLVDILPNGTVSPGTWENTAYEVVDGTVLYPPTLDADNNRISFQDLALVSHLEFQSEGIFHHPISVRELQLASQVLERSQFTEIGTRFGTPVYPYTNTGIYFNYKAKNPISIYKGSTPYLYLNRHSGWRVRGKFSPFIDRGISIPINQQRGLGTEVSAIQMWIRFSDRGFPSQDLEIFSVDFKNAIYDFYIKSDESFQRGYIFAKNRETGAIINTIQYYINGNPVDQAFIVNEQWSVIGLAFTELLDFDGYTGRLNLNGPMMYNNISYYLATNLEQNQRVEVRSWAEVKDQDWEYWDGSFTWAQVRVISTTNLYAIDPTAIYEKYVGTDRIIVDDNIDGLLIDPETLKVYSEVEWSTSTKIAV